jgi:hypothetical protein
LTQRSEVIRINNILAVPAASRSATVTHPARRLFLAVMLLLVLPILGTSFRVRAGFVPPVVIADTVSPGEIDLFDSPQEDRLARRKHPAATAQPDQPADQHSALKMLGVWKEIGAPSPRHETTNPGGEGAPVRNDLPLPQNQGPLPRVNCPAPDSQSGQGMGSTSAGFGSGFASHPAGLTTVPAITGPELAMRVFARESRLQVEDLAWRFFRPPRNR